VAGNRVSRQCPSECQYARVPEEQQITDAELNELVQRMDEAAGAFIRGDIEHYVSLFDHADEYTLMGPTGGETVRGFDSSEERLAQFRDFFAAGEARLEVAETYTSGNLAVIVAVERQLGEVGGPPTRTGRSGSRSSSGGSVTGGTSSIGIPTPWCMRSLEPPRRARPWIRQLTYRRARAAHRPPASVRYSGTAAVG
jgi:hypothetical protein